MGTNKAIFYPENYILLGNSDAQKAHADVIISEMKTSRPEKFEGNKDYFMFELRYAAPFDKSFHELKRLQGTASEAAGRRSDFKGYIVIDMSSWLTHHNDEYLNKALLFLVDMSECWKYIFLVDNQNTKTARELVGKILSVFFCDHIPCVVKEEDVKRSFKSRVNDLCKAQGVICSSQVKEFLQELMELEFSESVVAALLTEMSWSTGKKIGVDTLATFAENRCSSVSYMLTQKDYNRLLAVIDKRKENWHGEKEAV
mgnify:FL=1